MVRMFRYLTVDEVEVRISTVKSGKGVSLLLYKNARADQEILDETVGPLNWQRKHTRDNHNCIVSLWDEKKQQWVSKEDTGTESNAEAQKGLASDSFKRACFNWGIGRELYTSPFIWVGNDDKYMKYKCTYIKTENNKIVGLKISDKSNKVVFSFGDSKPKKTQTDKPAEPKKTLSPTEILAKLNTCTEGLKKNILTHYKVDNLTKLTAKQLTETATRLKWS